MLSYGKFRFVKADTGELRERIFRFRYRIYVEEFGFEKPENNPDGRETDEYETHAVHFAALNREGRVAGTIRLVLDSGNGLPMERAVNIRRAGEKPPPGKIAEVSRLAVSRRYRAGRVGGQDGVEYYLDKPEGEGDPGRGTDCEDRKRKMHAILMGLYHAVYYESKRLGLTHWYMISDKRVVNTFKRLGFLFQPIGEPVDYHGLRTPYVGAVSDIENMVSNNNPFMMKLVLRGLKKECHRSPECPLLGGKDIDSKEQICNGVGENRYEKVLAAI